MSRMLDAELSCRSRLLRRGFSLWTVPGLGLDYRNTQTPSASCPGGCLRLVTSYESPLSKKKTASCTDTLTNKRLFIVSQQIPSARKSKSKPSRYCRAHGTLFLLREAVYLFLPHDKDLPKQSGNSEHLEESGIGCLRRTDAFLTEERAQSFLTNSVWTPRPSRAADEAGGPGCI